MTPSARKRASPRSAASAGAASSPSGPSGAAATGELAGPARRGRSSTINDVARLAGVSKKTVSRVLNRSPLIRDDTRARVQDVIDRLGYAPDPQARGLAFRKSFLIGLVYDNPNAQYIVNMLEGALEGLRGTDFELVVHPCDRRNPDLVASVRHFAERQKLRGAILLPPVSENDDLTRALAEVDCRYVRVSYASLDVPGRMVTTSDRVAVAEAADYLESLGHRRIGFITGPTGFLSATERRIGFLGALAERGVAVAPDCIVEGGYTYESGVACADLLLSRRPRPTAIFASNDEMAAGVYRAAQRLGLAIPADLSVVGFDDGPLAARLLPSLTTVRLPIRELGRIAATKLIHPEMNRQDAGPLVPHLVVRDSCQPPRA
jgi:LacI family transcriptional regulator